MLKRTLTIVAITAGLLVLTAGVASAHKVYWGQKTWVGPEGCSWVESSISHYPVKAKGFTQAHTHNPGECVAYWDRPPNHIKVSWQLLYRDPVDLTWELCKSGGTKHNTGNNWQVVNTKSYGSYPPCGVGTYSNRSWGGVKVDGVWKGHLHIYSTNHVWEN